MTIGDSFFSFIKPSPARPPRRPAPQPAAAASQPAATPPPPPKQNDALAAKIAELELKIRALETKNSSTVPEAPGRAAESRNGKTSEPQNQEKLKQEADDLRARVAALEETILRPEFSDPARTAPVTGLTEERLQAVTSALTDSIEKRLSSLSSAFTETARKTSLALQTGSGAVRRLDKLDDHAAQMEHIKRRMESVEGKLEKTYDLDALVESLKTEVGVMGRNVNDARRDSALLSAENKKLLSDFESLSAQVRHFSALFNQMRTELAFLTPKREEPR